MKKLKLFMVTLFICLAFTLSFKEVRADDWMTVNAEVNSHKKVTIRWNKKANLYKIYRISVYNNGNEGKPQKIATLSSSKRSFVDRKVKKNRRYYYEVKAYKKSGKSYKLMYHETSYVIYTGYVAPDWDDYVYSDYPLSPKLISLHFDEMNGIKASGFKIYRRKSGTKSFKTIATIKAKKNKDKYIYTDKSVEKGATYYYKIKSYYNKGKKKIYSAYSDTIKMSAVNRKGIFNVSMITKLQNDVVSLDLKITSDAGNGDLELSNGTYFAYAFTNDFYYAEDYYGLTPAYFSTDGNNWKEIADNKKLVIKPKQTLYLRLQCEDGKKIPYLDIYNSGTRYMETEYCKYNNLPSYFTLKFDSTPSSAYVNLDFIH